MTLLIFPLSAAQSSLQFIVCLALCLIEFVTHYRDSEVNLYINTMYSISPH
jgi:hypothetical protein